MTATIQELAREAGRWFETARRATGDTETGPREDGDPYVRTRDGAPEWVGELVRDAHGRDRDGAPSMLPDDWRYACVRAALEALEDTNDPYDLAHEFADGYVDVYTGALLEWVGSHGSRVGYCDEAAEELGTDDDGRGIVQRLQLGQFAEALEVFESVRGSLEARVAALELDELVDEEA